MLLALLIGCVPKVLYPDVHTARPDEPVVQLRYADVVHPFGAHHFFVCWDPEEARWKRVELFERGGPGKRIHEDLFTPNQSFEIGLKRRVRLVREFRGAKAERLLAVLEQAPDIYPFQHRYYLVGPNSNSFAAWVLRKARVGHDFNTRAIGAHHPIGAGLSDTRTGVRLDASVFGIEIGLLDGIELRLGPVQLGLDLVPPAILTPVGRLGWPEPHLVLERDFPRDLNSRKPTDANEAEAPPYPSEPAPIAPSENTAQQ